MLSLSALPFVCSHNDRLLAPHRAQARAAAGMEPAAQALDDAELLAASHALRAEFALLPASGLSRAQSRHLKERTAWALALAREAARRAYGLRAYEVQLLGASVLTAGQLAEMRTGEGKTLTAALAAYVQALHGQGVHVVTVNEYLAQRDANWVRPILERLGLSVGFNAAGMSPADKQAAYACDVTYSTNSELGFDYLRDNMVLESALRVQRGQAYAVVDEVDSVLIDDARTPLIIAGPIEEDASVCAVLARLAPQFRRQIGEDKGRHGVVLEPGDFVLDLKTRDLALTETGHDRLEEFLSSEGWLPENANLYDPAHVGLLHRAVAALKAQHAYLRDKHYVVREGQVEIIDESTGRVMPGRRWSDGLHQAVEAKEGVAVQADNHTLATITLQNYFKLYAKLSGMTGTAATEAREFSEIYELITVVVPPHRPLARRDELDQVFRTTADKFAAVITDITDCQKRGQPVLVGTSSVENSELISRLLTLSGIPHQVLNAKQHAREAEIIAQAGTPGAVTIATNMAGRGTDILLGGNIEAQARMLADRPHELAALEQSHAALKQQVMDAGGLRVIGTERHESRRVDNQLRGRAGRQGDPGSSCFYLSLQDNLLRVFAGQKLAAVMDQIQAGPGEPLSSPVVTRLLEQAQRSVEAHHFESRKQLLEYDDTTSEQRAVFYARRKALLEDPDLEGALDSLVRGSVSARITECVPDDSLPEQWDVAGLQKIADTWPVPMDVKQWLSRYDEQTQDPSAQEVVQGLADVVFSQVNLSELCALPLVVSGKGDRLSLRATVLRAMDFQWRHHLEHLEQLREGIHLRAVAQKTPKQEFKREAFERFAVMLQQARDGICEEVMAARVPQEDPPEHLTEGPLPALAAEAKAEQPPANGSPEAPRPSATPGLACDARHVGRNAPCHCGSGLRFKLCHGKLAAP